MFYPDLIRMNGGIQLSVKRKGERRLTINQDFERQIYKWKSYLEH